MFIADCVEDGRTSLWIAIRDNLFDKPQMYLLIKSFRSAVLLGIHL